MYSQILIPTAPQGQRCCLVLLKSSTGTIQAEYIPVPIVEPPEAFIQNVKDLYEAKASNAKRAYYRCLLLSMPIVSTMATPSNPDHNAFIREVAFDDALSQALRKPERLANTPPALFLSDYNDIFMDASHNANLPSRAIMVHLRQDPVAAKIAGFLISALSLGLGIGLKVAGVS